MVRESDINARFVLDKLYRLKLAGADFNPTRWLVEWDISKPPVMAVAPGQREVRELRKLEAQGVLSLRVEENFQQGASRKYHEIKDYRISQFEFSHPSNDKAWEQFDWAVWVTDFNLEKFEQACRENGFEPATRTSEALLSLEGFNTPVVTINDVNYRMKSLKSAGMPEEIINYCLNDKAGSIITAQDLAENNIIEKKKINLKQIFAKTQFGENGVLRPFITIQSDRIKLKQRVMLSAEQQVKIITVASKL